ncbi:hypothetical protein BCIN_07g06820 [Botrytis cinerea B05.10]|uniref:Uncharacterized protein n=1 Tax=Botryotinia fuckeliana (strain B05.10) TaxID=332648 RepID=A0A384JNM3_BOTFB|nr:hypothetical protein BCIN_07g06820 [Botrytis cinerea B05.10]ATZ52189.1 hypothetical protein BCIN_07g06820 [Botrytis cinerea B05.10]
MPFNEFQRRDSWPPTIIHIRENNADIDAIDDDPFSYFLTSPDEITDDDIDDFSAGIMSDDEGKSEVREISPSSLQRASLEDEEDILFGFSIPLSLKDFTKVHGSGRESRAGHRMDQQLKGLGISISDFTTSRGRAKARLTPPQGRGRGETRSVPLRRPHSWREPSPDLRSIKEEGEEEEEVRGSGAMPSMVSSQAVESPKPKKKVHWAL